MKRTRAAGVALLVLGSLFVQVSPVVAGGSCYDYHSLDRKFFKKTNGARSNHNVNKLTLDPQLSRVARKHTKEMINKGYLVHTPNSVLAGRVTKWNMLAENIGKGGSVRAIQKAFMNSAAHRANILNGSYKYGGVGAKRAGGKVWVTVVFEATNNPGTTLNMPSC